MNTIKTECGHVVRYHNAFELGKTIATNRYILDNPFPPHWPHHIDFNRGVCDGRKERTKCES